MACPGSKSSIDLTGLSVFVQSIDPAGAAERLVFVVVDRLKCLIQVSARVGITFYRGLHQQKPSDRAREAHVLA